MKSINNILVPFNLEPSAIYGLEYALDFSLRDPDIIIHLLYIGDVEKEEAIKKEISRQVAILQHKHPAYRGKIDIMVSSGNLIDAILETQEKLNADLIVMGTEGIHQGDDDHTNTSELVLQADCPVIVIPSKYDEFLIKKIALVVGTKQIDDINSLGILLDFARRFGAEVHVLTIYSNEDEIREAPEEEYNERMLAYYLDKFYATHAYKESDDIEKGIYDYIEEKEIDILTILPRNHAKKGIPSEGKLTKLLTLKTRVPLLAID